MDVSRIRALRGPNLWSRHTAIQAIVTCEGGEMAIADLPDFEARLRERFPALGDLIPGRPSRHRFDGARPGIRRAWPASPSRLSGHLQS
jgi:hypothetical protein